MERLDKARRLCPMCNNVPVEMAGRVRDPELHEDDD
jgi:hypothetical protein